MSTAIDTNVIVTLWDVEESLRRLARAALDKAFNEGTLVISGAVYAELLAAPGRTEAFVDRFCEDTGIAVEWDVTERIWREAGRAYQRYAGRRRRRGGSGPRRILADFVIGAQALINGHKLLTLDEGIYKASFPGLVIVPI